MMKKTKKVAILMFSLLSCSVMSIGVVSTLDAAADKNADSYTVFRAESVFAYDNLYDLYATITEAPDSIYVSDEGEPDFTNVKFAVYAVDANGLQNAILTDATFDDLKTAFDVSIENIPLIPSGIMSKITLSAFSNNLNETVSTSVEVTFSKKVKNDALSKLCMEITKEPNDPVVHGDSDLDLTGITMSVYETYVDGTVKQTLTDATLDEVEKMYSVKIKQESGAPVGGICTITIGAYSEAQYREIYASDSFNYAFGAPLPEYLRGDVNADGLFNISDVVLLQKWLLVIPDTNLANWKAADLCEDGRLNVFDLCLMKRELISNIVKEVYPVENPEVIDEFTPCTAILEDDFMDWAIHVTIKHQYSVPNRLWTIEDFAGVNNIKSVKQYDMNAPYRQMLEISLKNCSKENVLTLIHDIESLNIVEIKEINTFSYGTGDL